MGSRMETSHGSHMAQAIPAGDQPTCRESPGEKKSHRADSLQGEEETRHSTAVEKADLSDFLVQLAQPHFLFSRYEGVDVEVLLKPPFIYIKWLAFLM